MAANELQQVGGAFRQIRFVDGGNVSGVGGKGKVQSRGVTRALVITGHGQVKFGKVGVGVGAAETEEQLSDRVTEPISVGNRGSTSGYFGSDLISASGFGILKGVSDLVDSRGDGVDGNSSDCRNGTQELGNCASRPGLKLSTRGNRRLVSVVG